MQHVISDKSSLIIMIKSEQLDIEWGSADWIRRRQIKKRTQREGRLILKRAKQV